jgi:hypothetical protein
VPPEYVYGTELPDADAARRNLVTNLSMDVARPGDPASGTHVLYQDIFIPPA